MPNLFNYETRVKMIIPYIESALEKGVSKTALYNQLKGTELGMRKTDFLKLFDAVATMRREGGPLVTNWNLKENALYRFEATFVNPQTGEEKKQNFSLYAEEPIPLEFARKKMELELEVKDEKYMKDYGLEGFKLVALAAKTPVFREEVAPRWVKALARVYAKGAPAEGE